MRHSSTATLLAVISAIVLAGCGEGGTEPAALSPNVTLSVASVPMEVNAPASLTIESAKILLKNIKFSQAGSDDSADFKAGPYAVPLILSGVTTEIAAGFVKPGVYDRLRFVLHKPEDTEPIPDSEFREGTSGNLRYSTIVRGTYNGQAFIYKSNQNADQDIHLASSIVVNDQEDVHVTIHVDTSTWFVHGGVTLDPSDSANRQIIDDNIKNSFEAFRDLNRDGRAD